jgi:hypothetical protein
MSFHTPEDCRVITPQFGSRAACGANGAFRFPSVVSGRELWCIASDGAQWKAAGLTGPPWEHVSVHVFNGRRTYTPTWIEMCQVKDLFWDAEDLVIQFHPRASEYVNNHPNVLHLWRPIGVEIPTPPPATVGLL